MNIYLELTRKFNDGRLRAILSGGQAVVLHRLAMMSKDGDWIIREDGESTAHIVDVLHVYGARYRFGAPLDGRWLAGGWSAHFEFQHEEIRVRTDFVSRPPRLSASELERLWSSQKNLPLPRVPLRELAELKKTNREKDYAVIGELARLMSEPDHQIIYSRSARDLIELARRYPDRVEDLSKARHALRAIKDGLEALESAIDSERRQLIHANEARLLRYMKAAERWADAWPDVANEIEGKQLSDAHRIICGRAKGLLPFAVGGMLP